MLVETTRAATSVRRNFPSPSFPLPRFFREGQDEDGPSEQSPLRVEEFKQNFNFSRESPTLGTSFPQSRSNSSNYTLCFCFWVTAT